MRITFEMSGGYGGLFALRPLSFHVDTADLSETDREELLALVRSSGLLEATAAETAAASGRPDVYHYRLSIAHERGAASFAFDDLTAPANVRPLLQHLQQRAVQERMGR